MIPSMKIKRKSLWIGILVTSLLLCFSQLWLVSPIGDRRLTTYRLTTPYSDVTGNDIVTPRNPGERWVVVDAEDEPCDVAHYTKLPHWKTVVVRALKVDHCSPPLCTTLDHQEELGLGRRLDRVLPRRSPARRMVAYLYCMAQGAKVIYDGACSLRPRRNLSHFLPEKTTSGLVYQGPSPFDPYRYFGVPESPSEGFINSRGWKRGKKDLYSLHTLPFPQVQQGLPFDCQQEAHRQRPRSDVFQEENIAPAFTENGTLGPLGPANTAFTSEAFWTLVLPFTELSPKELWLRSYMIQTLVHSQGGRVGYFSSTADCERLPKIETRSNWSQREVEAMHKFFLSWRCPETTPSFECLLHLTSTLVDGGYLEEASVNITRAWIHDLTKVGYNLSVPHAQEDAEARQGIPVVYTSPGRLHHDVLNNASNVRKAVEKELVSRMKKLCPKARYQAVSVRSPVFENIMLIVVLIYKTLHQNIPILDTIHRRVYRHILYCGTDAKDIIALRNRTGLDYISYVQGVNGTWYQQYDCVRHAMRINANVEGYLFIGDDTLVNFWATKQFPRDRLWLPGGKTTMSRDAVSHPWHWFWWTRPQGREAINNAFRELEYRAPADKAIATFLANINKRTHGAKVAYHRAVDIFYVPQRLREQFLVISEVFSRNQVLHELAVPTMFFGLDREQNFVHLRGSSLWRDDRVNAVTFFNETHAFLHPFKAKSYLKTPAGLKFFCQRFIPLVEKNYKRSPRLK